MLTRATFPSADMYLTARYGKFVDSGFRSSPLVHRAITALFTAAERWLPAVTRIADLILQRGGAYQLAVKENQGQLYQDLNDIAFREDESSVRKDHAPENLAVL